MGKLPGRATVLPVLLSLVGAGCSYLGTARDYDPREVERGHGVLVVRGVPLVLQKETEDCGPAALAMVLGYWGVSPSFQVPVQEDQGEKGHGTRAADLRDQARAAGLTAFLIHGELADLERELALGHPVLVGLVKPYVSGARAHYEVVVARRLAEETVITLDPARGWRANSVEGFLKEWDPSGRLTLVIFRDDRPGGGTP